MPRNAKSIPVCACCGKFTCADCGAGFATKELYLAHRVDTLAHAEGEPEPAPA